MAQVQDSATWQAVIETVEGILTTGAALAGVYLAWSGVTAWKKQLTGTAEYELARRLLRATYQLKYAISGIRSPMVTNIERQDAERESGLGEQPPDPDSPGRSSYRHESEKAVYKARWSQLEKPLSEFESAMLEAEVLWGDTRDYRVPINKVIIDLQIAVENYLMQSGPDRIKLDRQKRKEVEATIWRGSVPEAEDRFNQMLESAVKTIEDFVRPHLGRRAGQK